MNNPEPINPTSADTNPNPTPATNPHTANLGNPETTTPPSTDPTSPTTTPQTPNLEEPTFPETIDKYFTQPEGITITEDDAPIIDALRQTAFANKIPESALAGLTKDMLAFADGIREQQTAILAEQQTQLAKTYGSKLPAVLESINNTVTNLATEAGVSPTIFNDPTISTNPDIIKFFHHIAEKFKESNFHSTTQQPAIVNAQQEIDSILNGGHPLHEAYMNSSHPQHAKAQATMNNLLQLTQ